MSKKSSRKYPESFILQIIDQYEKRERSIALLAELNGVSVHTVKYWIKEYKSKGMDALMGNKKIGYKITYAPEFKVRVIDYWMEHLELFWQQFQFLNFLQESYNCSEDSFNFSINFSVALENT